MCLPDDTTPARVAPTRIYRWERDEESYHEDGGMLLCWESDSDEPQDQRWVALYWHWRGEWHWHTAHGPAEGECATEDAARRACELAVLHAERES